MAGVQKAAWNSLRSPSIFISAGARVARPRTPGLRSSARATLRNRSPGKNTSATTRFSIWTSTMGWFWMMVYRNGSRQALPSPSLALPAYVLDDRKRVPPFFEGVAGDADKVGRFVLGRDLFAG